MTPPVSIISHHAITVYIGISYARKVFKSKCMLVHVCQIIFHNRCCYLYKGSPPARDVISDKNRFASAFIRLTLPWLLLIYTCSQTVFQNFIRNGTRNMARCLGMYCLNKHYLEKCEKHSVARQVVSFWNALPYVLKVPECLIINNSTRHLSTVQVPCWVINK